MQAIGSAGGGPAPRPSACAPHARWLGGSCAHHVGAAQVDVNDLVLPARRVPVQQDPDTARWGTRPVHLRRAQKRYVGPAQVPRRPRREGRPQVGRRREECAGDVRGGDAVGLGDRRPQLARPRQDRLRRVLVDERCPANPPAPYRRGPSQDCRCPVCGVDLLNGEELQRHYKQPRSLGGSNASGNRDLVHLNCHQQRHARLRRAQQAAAGDERTGP
jgi:hypothetical protein